MKYKHYYTQIEDIAFLFRSFFLYKKIVNPNFWMDSSVNYQQKNLTNKDFLLKDCFLGYGVASGIWIAIERQNFFQLVENVVHYSLVSSVFPLSQIIPIVAGAPSNFCYISPQEKVKSICSLCSNQLLCLVEQNTDQAFSTIKISKKCLLGMKKDLFSEEAGTIEFYGREFLECNKAFGHQRTPKSWVLRKLTLVKYIQEDNSK